MPDVHGLCLKSPAALGHAYQSEIEKEQAEDWGDQAQTDLR
jgi:hypothetical protein